MLRSLQKQLFCLNNGLRSFPRFINNISDEINNPIPLIENNGQVSGESDSSKVHNLVSKEENVIHNEEPTFEYLLHNSPLMKFGRPNRKCVVGKITDICNDDIYVDFGAKHEAVVRMPAESNLKVIGNVPQDYYKKGALVRLILDAFESTGKFIGDDTHITINEANAYLVGPYIPGVKQP